MRFAEIRALLAGTLPLDIKVDIKLDVNPVLTGLDVSLMSILMSRPSVHLLDVELDVKLDVKDGLVSSLTSSLMSTRYLFYGIQC